MKQIPLAIGPEPLPTFDSFLPGANAAALQHLRALALPARAGLPVGPGRQRQDAPAARAGARAARQRASGSAGSTPPTRLPWTLPPGWSLVRASTAATRWTPARSRPPSRCSSRPPTHGVQVAAAGRLPPVDLPLRDDLRTRLGWGHVFALQPLAEAETRAVLRREADRRGIFLSDEVMDYLLTRFARDLSHLMRLLDRLDDFALAERAPVTVPLLRADAGRRGRVEARA